MPYKKPPPGSEPLTVCSLPIILLFAMLAACNSGEQPEATIAVQDKDNEPAAQVAALSHAPEEAAAAHPPAILPLEQRVAFMAGHVEAALALIRANAPDQAAMHLLHPVSETHADERAGLAALGFDAALFRNVSQALEAGHKADALEAQLVAAKANITLIEKNAGGDPAAIIAYLLDITAEEYAIGVSGGIITDPGEYQDAYGFTVVARDTALRLPAGPYREPLVQEIDGLLALWPENGPLADSTPAPVAQIIQQIARVRATLADSGDSGTQ